MTQELEDFDVRFFDKAIQNFEELETESRAVIIAAIKLQIESHNPYLEELINHHYNTMRHSKNSQEILRFLREKLT